VGAIAGASLMMDLEGWRTSRSVECGLGIEFGRKNGVGALGLFLGIFRCEKSGVELKAVAIKSY
jgi:hypothetical protein